MNLYSKAYEHQDTTFSPQQNKFPMLTSKIIEDEEEDGEGTEIARVEKSVSGF